jgi:hypothetical protein
VGHSASSPNHRQNTPTQLVPAGLDGASGNGGTSSRGDALPVYVDSERCSPLPAYMGIFRRYAKLRKAAVSFVMSVRLSVRMEDFGSHWTDYHEIWY